MYNNNIIGQIKNFRQLIYHLIPKRADSTINLIDSLSSNTNADSVTKLSLNEQFKRKYSSISDAISNFLPNDNKLRSVSKKPLITKEVFQKTLSLSIDGIIPEQRRRHYFLFAGDCTPISRPFAYTMDERHVTYKPNPAPGNKPITIGHTLSAITWLPEKMLNEPSWVLPISVRRVASNEKGSERGLTQITELIKEPKFTFSNQLCVFVGDTSYGVIGCQKISSSCENLIMITRAASNRVFYFPPELSEKNKSGHPIWYGDRIKLSDEQTHKPPEFKKTIQRVTRKGKTFNINISCWYNIRMRGKNDFATHEYSFTLVRAIVTDNEGRNIYKRPLWLMVFGKKREELQITDIYDNYCQRYDIEHFFRFGKQRLLLNSFQTPELAHEESWFQIVSLAYIQLYLCREIADKIPNPWEKYQDNYRQGSVCTPTQVLKDFGRLVNTEIGTPAKEPKVRGIPSGREKDYRPQARSQKDVIFKGKRKLSKTITSGSGKKTSLAKPKSYSQIVEKITNWVENIGISMSDFLKKANSDFAFS